MDALEPTCVLGGPLPEDAAGASTGGGGGKKKGKGKKKSVKELLQGKLKPESHKAAVCIAARARAV